MSFKISNLPSGSTPLSGGELVEIVQGGNSRKINAQQIANLKQDSSIDHGSLIGLGDDDHTQYMPVDASRSFSQPVSGQDPTKDEHLVTKQHLDTETSQYMPTDASKSFSQPVSGQDPTKDEHLVTLQYLEQLTSNQIKAIAYTTPVRGILDDQFPIVGTLREVDTAQTGDVATDFPVSNQHAYIYVNSITTGGDIVITGTSLPEATAVPSAGDTETLTIDTSTGQYYQTSKKWWEITNIDVTSGTIVSINYNYGVVGYPDLGNRNFSIDGYRVDAYCDNNSADFRLIILKIQDDGNGKMSVVPIEDIGVDSGSATDQIIDGLRTGAFDRSLNPAVSNIWLDNTTLTFKQLDFNTYFSSDENIFESASKNEGYIIRLEGAPTGGISNLDFISLELFYKLT